MPSPKLKLNPVSRQRWARFKNNKRAKFSLFLFILLTLFSYAAELFVNSKALVVKYKGEYFFPVIASVKYGKDFGLAYDHEVDYRQLQQKFAAAGEGDWVLMPLVPFSPQDDVPINQSPLDEELKDIERRFQASIAAVDGKMIPEEEKKRSIADLKIAMTTAMDKVEKLKYHPLPPDWQQGHYLGTDKNGYDVFSRIVYGYRTAINFSLALLIITYSFGMTIGCLMGYWGGWFDLITQRIIEVFSNIPFLYVAIIVAAIMIENKMAMGFKPLLAIFAALGWMGITWYMRTATLKEREREYIIAAKAIGASDARVIFSHIIPNIISLPVTFIPFAVSGTIIGLTSLDFLGYGFPKGEPSWGELIQQGTENTQAYWIVTSVVAAMVLMLFLINSIGEGVREAFDPKKVSRYQ